MIGAGASVDTLDKDGCSVLMTALWHGAQEVAMLCFVRDARVDVRDKDGETALMLASFKGPVPLVGMLCLMAAPIAAP